VLTAMLRAGEMIKCDCYGELISMVAFFIDNLLVRIHLIIEMILVDRPCAMGV